MHQVQGLVKSIASAIEVDWVVIEAPNLNSTPRGSTMKHQHLTPGARAFVAFAGAVVLAVLAAASLLYPEAVVHSVDSIARTPSLFSEP